MRASLIKSALLLLPAGIAFLALCAEDASGNAAGSGIITGPGGGYLGSAQPDPDGGESFTDSAGGFAGRISSSGVMTDPNGGYMGRISDNGVITDSSGGYAGKISDNGTLTGPDGGFAGRLGENGMVMGPNGGYLGRVPAGDRTAAFRLLKNAGAL